MFAISEFVRRNVSYGRMLFCCLISGFLMGLTPAPAGAQIELRRMQGEIEAAINNLERLRGVMITERTPEGPLVRGYLAARIGVESIDKDAPHSAPDIYLPSIRVTLRDPRTGEESAPTMTDLSGRFTLRAPRKGRYLVCYEGGGFDAGCLETFISADRAYRSIGTLIVPIVRRRNAITVFGDVRLADGSVPRALAPTFNANSFAIVSLHGSKGGTRLSVPVNNDGLYIMPNTPLLERLALRVRHEGYKHAQPMVLGAVGRIAQRVDLVIANSAPRIQPLVAQNAAGRRLGAARGGDVVTLRARVDDPDGDALQFRWQVTGGDLDDATARETTWRLPTRAGAHAAVLLAFDGRGGYARSEITVSTRPGGLLFSGVVRGSDAAVLAGAQVDVNGRVAVTDSRGFFRLSAPDRERFVMTIRRDGYAFASNIYADSVTGGAWTLTKAQVFTVDPTQPIDLQNTRSARECPGPASARMDWDRFPTLAEPQWQDGRGDVVPAPKDARAQPGLPRPEGGKRTPRSDDPKDDVRSGRDQDRDCGPGVRVRIPANALVDAAGDPPQGDVQVQLSTVDLASANQMPGNDTVVDGDKVGVMQSWGAGVVEIRAGGRDYDLRPGMSAELVIPVDRTQIEAGGPLPPTIPLISYDEKRGVWRQDGEAKLDAAGGQPIYVAEATHFTAYNADLIKTDQSCVALQNQGMPASYDLEVTIPRPGGAAPTVRTFPAVEGGVSETALLNLPSDTNITLVPIRTTAADPSQNGLPMGVFVVNTGGPQNPAWPTVLGGFQNEPQGPPYYQEDGGGNPVGACSTRVVVQDLGLNFYDPPTPVAGAFLHGLGSFAAVNLSDVDPAFPADANAALRDAVAQASEDYRAQIDPRGLRTTLSCYKIANRMPLDPGETCPDHAVVGFTPLPPLAETAAVYANTIDLGFGREMHCVQNGADVACYVSNYESLVYTGPGEGTDVFKAQAAADGLANLIAPDATVAMEFTRIEDAGAPGDPIVLSDPERVVKFYVFGGDGLPVDAANLDGLGARPVPQLCMACHGGFIPNPSGAPATAGGVPTAVFASRNDVKLGAKFLPFDLASFSYAAPDTDVGNPANKLNQQAAFRTLNQMVAAAPPPDPGDPSSTVIVDLLDAWYPGGATPQNEDAVVPAWNGDPLRRATYRGTVARGCRTCHVANPEPNLRFEAPGAVAGNSFDGNLGAIQLRVCRQHVMPHARRTHDLFWTSTGPNLPAQLQAYGDSVNANGWQVVGGFGVDPTLACGQEFTQGGAAPTAGAFDASALVLSTCVGCHNAGNAAPGSAFNVAGLDLAPAGAYAQLVGVAATELPSFDRVAFGSSDEDDSYLWRKIADTHLGLGGYVAPGPGVAMPQGGPGLLSADAVAAETIRAWLQGGAAP